MMHWNRNCLVAIDIMTTGGDSSIFEICEIAILPLTTHLTPNKSVLPIHFPVRPLDPGLVDYANSRLTRTVYADILQKAFDPATVITIIEDWWAKKLNLGVNKYNNPLKMIPLVYDAEFTIPFLRRFFGEETYAMLFRPEYRDLLATATFLSDHHGFHCRPVLTGTGKCQWNYICNKYNAEARLQPGALQRALAMSQAYQDMVRGLTMAC